VIGCGTTTATSEAMNSSALGDSRRRRPVGLRAMPACRPTPPAAATVARVGWPPAVAPAVAASAWARVFGACCRRHPCARAQREHSSQSQRLGLILRIPQGGKDQLDVGVQKALRRASARGSDSTDRYEWLEIPSSTSGAIHTWRRPRSRAAGTRRARCRGESRRQQFARSDESLLREKPGTIREIAGFHTISLAIPDNRVAPSGPPGPEEAFRALRVRRRTVDALAEARSSGTMSRAHRGEELLLVWKYRYSVTLGDAHDAFADTTDIPRRSRAPGDRLDRPVPSTRHPVRR